MNESRCKACDAELVYIGSITRGGALKCPHCDLSNGKPPAKSGSYLYANTQDEEELPCEYCGTYHKIWEQCDDGTSALWRQKWAQGPLIPCDGRKFSRKKYPRLFEALRGQK